MLFISNFVLELINYKLLNEKDIIVIYCCSPGPYYNRVSGFFPVKENLKLFDLVSFGIIVLVIAFALFIGYKRFTSAKKGEPA